MFVASPNARILPQSSTLAGIEPRRRWSNQENAWAVDPLPHRRATERVTRVPQPVTSLTRLDHKEQFAKVQSPSRRRVHPSGCCPARSGPVRRKSN
jgi:hypothetical protein